jgi:pantoate--beta-alanine ligase
MYPPGFQTIVSVPAIARRWEGEARPHHFAGVATVVTKLFGIVRPHIALFGQKDFQQAAVVHRLVKDLSLGVEIVVRPTVREPDGLAMSSRNVYLSAKQRAVAPLLYRSLQTGAAAIRRGVREGSAVEGVMREVMRREPSVATEYLAVCDPVTLEPLTAVDRRAVLLGAMRLGSVRLIDNLLVTVGVKR